MTDDDELLTRRALRHMLLRRRNARVAELRDERLPNTLTMSQGTLEELLIDSDPYELATLDFEGNRFMEIPIVVDDRLAKGDVVVDWPAPLVTNGDSLA